MATYSITCPHCRNQGVATKSIYAVADPTRRDVLYSFSVCGLCGMPVIARFGDLHTTHPNTKQARVGEFSQQNLDATYLKFTLLGIWPEPPPPTTPKHLPEQVARAYSAGEFNLAHGEWNTAGMALRRALDVGTKLAAPAHAGVWLKQRLKKMADEHLITQDLGDWATLLKDRGDSANHDEDEFTEQEAKFMLELARLVLTYIFTLPAMVKEAQKATAEAADEPPS